LIPLYRRALRDAAAVTCVSEPLADLVRDVYGARGRVLALPSTIDQNLFHPRDRRDSRTRLGFPQDAKLIGTAGGLSREKGIEPLYRAFEILAHDDPDLHLALAGTLGPDCPPPRDPRVHYLGMLAHARIPVLLNSLDVGVVYLRDTPYGRYSFPQKAYEMAASGVPIAVAQVGVMGVLFEETPQAFYQPDDTISLVKCIKAQLIAPIYSTFPIPDWAELSVTMEAAYQDIFA